MKSKTLFLIGGLAFAGVALAGDPAPQSTASAPSLKVGIDKATGKLRPLTATESNALDSQAQRAALGSPVRSNQPATVEESIAQMRTSQRVPGIQGFRVPVEMMSSLEATRNADGTITFSENGQPLHSPKTQEAASE